MPFDTEDDNDVATATPAAAVAAAATTTVDKDVNIGDKETSFNSKGTAAEETETLDGKDMEGVVKPDQGVQDEEAPVPSSLSSSSSPAADFSVGPRLLSLTGQSSYSRLGATAPLPEGIQEALKVRRRPRQ